MFYQVCMTPTLYFFSAGFKFAASIPIAMTFSKEEFGDVAIKLSGQKHLEGFYNKHGFQSTEKEYLEDGIPHVEMKFTP